MKHVSTSSPREHLHGMLARLGQANGDPSCLRASDIDALAHFADKPDRRLFDLITLGDSRAYSHVTDLQQGLLRRPDLLYADSPAARTVRRLVLTDDIRVVEPHLDRFMPFALREPEVGSYLMQRALHAPKLLLPGIAPLLDRQPGATIVLSLFAGPPTAGASDPWHEPCARDLNRLSLEQIDPLSERLTAIIHPKAKPMEQIGRLVQETLGGREEIPVVSLSRDSIRHAAARGLALIAERVGQFDRRSDRIARDLITHAIGQVDSRALERGLSAWLVSPVVQRKTHQEVLDRVLRLDGDKRAMVTAQAVQVTEVLLARDQQPRRRELVEYLLRQAQGGHAHTRQLTGHILGRMAGLEQGDRERFATSLGNKPLTAVLGQRMPVVERFLDGLPTDVAPLLAEHLQIGLLTSLTADPDSPTERKRAELTQRASKHLGRFSVSGDQAT
jgi:hypothetical protein